MQPAWPKRFAIVAPARGVVGYSDLEIPTVIGRRAAGRIILADAWDSVRDVFELYRNAGDRTEELRRFVERRDELGLFVSDGGTLPLAARVELISEWSREHAYVYVSVRDRRYWSSRHGLLR